MSKIEVSEPIHIKICLLGSEKVGKTSLAHKLTDLDYEEYRPAVECQKFIKQLSEKKQILIYYDYPPIRTSLVEELTRDHRFDMMVCLFKDSVSFGQLYEFFAEISKKTEENDHKFNEYWQSIKNIILVYSDFDAKEQVQLQQLFNVLIQQIRNFNRTASIKQFMLKPQLSNHQYLRYLIEKNRFQERISSENLHLPKAKQVKSAKEEKVSEMITEMPSSHYASQKQQNIDPDRNDVQDEDMPELAQVKLTSTKEKALSSQGSIQQDDKITTLGKRLIADQQIQIRPQEIINYTQKSQQISETQEKISKDQKMEKQQTMTEVKQERVISVRDESQQTLQLFRQQDKMDQSKLSPQEKQQKIKVDQTLSLHDKEKQHYQQVYNKLMAKIHKEEVQESKKASYQDLFQEFRRTSKEESKISKELHDYWQQKIQKLQQEDEQDDEEEAENQEEEEQQDEVRYVEPKQQQKRHPRSTQPHHKKHSEPLKPQSNYLETSKPRRQKSTKDSKPCFCSIM